MNYEETTEYHNLLKRLKRCTNGTMWKHSTAWYWLNRMINTYLLWQDIQTKKYRISKYLWFTITEPKLREIYASHIRDRQYQHALIDDIVYPAVTQRFVWGNCACQKGKGTKFCIDLFVSELREYARKNGNTGYILQCDVKGFFPNTNHDVACANIKKYVDGKTAKACQDVIRSFAEIEFARLLIKSGMDRHKAHHAGHRISNYLIYGGEWESVTKGLSEAQKQIVDSRIKEGSFKGVGLGSQVTQTTQIALLDELDHYIVETLGIKVYVRYMDDFVLVHESKIYLRYCKEKIAELLKQKKHALNPKTQLFPLSQGLNLLHWHIKTTITGKVVIHKCRSNINKERRRLRKQKKKMEAGQMDMKAIENSFQCWQAGLLQQKCYYQVLQMRRYYWNLYERRAPEWKSKYRESKMLDARIMSSMPEHIQWTCCVNGMIPQ